MDYVGLHPSHRLRQACKNAIEELKHGEAISEHTLERVADNLATQAAIARDQLDGRPSPWLHGPYGSAGTILRRVRKALGFTYP